MCASSKRHQQRQCILECLYAWDMQPDVAIETIYKDYCQAIETQPLHITLPIAQAPFVLETLLGVVNHQSMIDETIQKYAQNWDMARIAKVDLAILRCAIYELVFSRQTPVPVIINEAIELSKQYATDDSKRFINGILDKIAKDDVPKPKGHAS